MVQMKVTASVLIAAAAIVPAVAYGFETEDSLVTREDNDLFAREPIRGRLLKNVRTGLRYLPSGPPPPQPEGRELDDDLYEREPFRGGAMFRDVRTGVRHGGFGGSSGSEQNEAREFNDELSERELEVDLLERDFDDTDLFEREFVEDLTERGIDDDELFERDLEFDSDLFERSPEPFSLSKWWQNLTHPKKTAKPTTDDSTATPDARDFDEMEDLTERGIDDDELFERDLEFDSDLFERSPEPFSLGKWWNNLTHPKKTAKPTTDDSTATPDARDFDEMEDLTERGIDNDELFERDLEFDSDLFERSPEPFSLSKWWNNLTHPKKTAKPTTDDSTTTPDARDFDEMELLEREYYDELD